MWFKTAELGQGVRGVLTRVARLDQISPPNLATLAASGQGVRGVLTRVVRLDQISLPNLATLAASGQGVRGVLTGVARLGVKSGQGDCEGGEIWPNLATLVLTHSHSQYVVRPAPVAVQKVSPCRVPCSALVRRESALHPPPAPSCQ